MLLASLGWPALSSGAAVELSAPASNGYRILVKGSAGKVTLSVIGSAGVATYRVPGRASRHGLTANFGRRGIVDVAFRPADRMEIETPPNRCEGRPRITRWGAFAGTIRFRGERGFARARVRRATGSISANPRWKCERRRTASGPEPPALRRIPWAAENDEPVVWELVDRRRHLEVEAFSIGRGNEFSLTAFAASMRERRGRMRIKRTAFELGADKEFAYDESLTNATIAPPPPFAGKGAFERRKGRDSWTGTLSVVLPGTPRISLIGKRFHPRLYSLGKDGIAKPGV